jgi:hypothetical protein
MAANDRQLIRDYAASGSGWDNSLGVEEPASLATVVSSKASGFFAFPTMVGRTTLLIDRAKTSALEK